MEAATLAGLAGTATGPSGRFAASPQSRRPAKRPGPVNFAEEAPGVDAQVPSAMPYAQRLRREGIIASSSCVHLSAMPCTFAA